MNSTVNKEIKRILVVDDDMQFNGMVQAILNEEGYHVLSAYDGHMAISSAKRFHPDVILMDVNMPMMDGLKAFDHLRSDPETNRIPVIFVTEALSQLVRPVVEASPRAAHLKKPFDLTDLTALVRQFCQSYAA